MENQIIKKSYKLSHIILAIFAFLIFNIMFINEDISWKFLSFIFSLITFIISFPSSIISKKIINIGDKIKSRIMQVLFYIIILPIFLFSLFLLIYLAAMFIFDTIPNPELGQSLLILFIVMIITIIIIIPYIQTIIILILNRLLKKI